MSNERTFELKFGYPDKNEENVIHKKVTFSRRPTAREYLEASASGEDSNTRYRMAMVAAAMSAFGSLKPVPPSALFELNRIDRELLFSEFMSFAAGAEHKPEQRKTGEVKLAFGIERSGVRYDIVKFGQLLTGHDEVKIEESAETTAEETALKLAMEVVEITTCDGAKHSAGALTREEVEAMDFADFIALRACLKSHSTANLASINRIIAV